MLKERSIATATNYWAEHLGCSPDELFSQPFRLVTHGGELDGYGGVFALFRGASVIASLPPDREEELWGLLSSWPHGGSAKSFAAALGTVSSRVIGPAYIGYAEEVPAPVHPARPLGSEDAAALDALEKSCDPTEWEHGGSSMDQPCSGVFVGGQLAAVAGYEVWGGTIAHIAIVTHPNFRGLGYGRSAVAHLAGRALDARLLPQYRTLESNFPSIRVAESLGFERYAVSTAVRLHA